jgi:hypothetical protein
MQRSLHLTCLVLPSLYLIHRLMRERLDLDNDR